MDALADDLGQAKPGEAQQVGVQWVVGKGGGQVGGECRSPACWQAGEVDQDGAGQVAQADFCR